jgi:hypothetical protein
MRFFDQHCDDCDEGRAHCHGTLVLHADETVECDEQARCGADEVTHRWWVTCAELGCGCTGDEVAPAAPVTLARAA